jgi:(1->4)-alpha-D-glucan 1-alpha-D-glucosylmutase
MIPRATYRLQFNKDFGFDAAAQIAPYLAQLGISHVYASPWLKARPGSSHGYDIVDHHALNPELGNEAAFAHMLAAFQSNGLRALLDFVPNHMGVGGADNPHWLDVLEWGPESKFAGWFDVDWRSDRRYGENKLLVPFLGDQYGVELYSGKLKLRFDEREGTFAVWAYDTHKLPISPLDYGRILGDAHPELERLGDAFANLPEWRPQAGRRAGELKAELALAASERPEVAEAIAQAVTRFNGVPGDKESWQALNGLIANQHWRAAYFRVAADDINYRRFFNINELAGLRMELPDVFEHAHALVLRLLRDQVVDGLRIDHVDGLLDPKDYLIRLRASAPADPSGAPFYLVVEKILARHENLREDWPVDGTTGYDFTNLALSLLIDPAGEAPLTAAYIEFTGDATDFAETVRGSKLRIMRNEMAGELNVLAREAARVARQNPKTADFTRNVLRRAIRAAVASFPVYRLYIDPANGPTEEDRRYLTWAIEQARARETEVDPSVFDFLYELLSGDLVRHGRSGFSRQAVLRFAMRLQQYSGPVMAKGLEDTAFYRYNRFIALNEVGGDPDQFGASLASFHKANAQRAARWPNSMLSSSTHDSKRGEDARARLAVLSEIPDEWARQVRGWSRILRARRGDIEAKAPPDRNDEYMIYQLLLGGWPMELTGAPEPAPDAMRSFAERLKGAVTKSIREAKRHSTWASPNLEYESAVLSFIDGALDPEESRAFLAAFLPFQERIARLGVENSLVQTGLKLTVPGVPDIYQGSELWNLSFVDPDNRRPVDYGERADLLASLGRISMRDLLGHWQDGAVKLSLISRLLALRAALPDLFEHAPYEPLQAEGPKAQFVCAFARRSGNCALLAIFARFPARREAEPDWSGTTVPSLPDLPSTLRNVLTGAEIDVSGARIDVETALGGLPLAVFASPAPH